MKKRLLCFITSIVMLFGMISGSIFIYADEGASLSVVLAEDSRTATATLTGADASGSYRIAVWSDTNGQDDLKWINMTASGNGFSAAINISDLKHSGKVHVHCYSSAYVAGAAFDVPEGAVPVSQPASVSFSALNTSNGAFSVYVSNLNGASARVAIWCADDQNDLKWYDISGDTVSTNISSHKSHQGVYKAHVYVNTNGSWTYSCGTSAELTGMAQASPELSVSHSGTDISASVTNAGSFTNVGFALWSTANGQDDLKWYYVQPSGGTASKAMSANDHSGGGEYILHVYGFKADGSGTFIGGEAFTADAPASQTTSPEISFAMNSTTDSAFTINVGGIPSNINKVQVAVWSSSDQSNLKWYSTSSISGGSATFSGNLSNHGYKTGDYYAHVYVTDTSGKSSFFTGEKITVKVTQGEVPLTITSGKGNFGISGAKTYGLVSQVRYAVWSEAYSQKDLKWVSSGSGPDYLATLDMSSYSATGKYYVHAYATLKDGSSVFIGGNTFTLDQVYAQTTVTTQRISDGSYSFTIKNANINGQAATRVAVPTWTNGTQDDLKWIDAVKQSDGSYTLTINWSDFQNSGKYTSHVYVFVGSASKFVYGEDYNMYLKRSYDSAAKEVMRKIIMAVETGGQIYGNGRYNDFEPAYNNFLRETAITIGSCGWYANEARTLLLLIQAEDPESFAKLDTAGIAEDLLQTDWSKYGTDGGTYTDLATARKHRTIEKDSDKAKCIQAILDSDAGRTVQHRLLDEQITKYIEEAASYGVTDLQAQMFLANLRHLGGKSAMVRIINNCKKAGVDLVMDNIWTVMQNDKSDSTSDTQVGDSIFDTRNIKVMQWLKTYL